MTALRSELGGWRSWYFFRRPVLWTLAVFCSILTILKTSGHWPADRNSELTPYLNQRVCTSGVVNDQPDQRPNGCVLSVQLETITLLSSTDTVTRSLQAQIQLYALGSTRLNIFPGDRVRACGTFQQPASPTVPGVFDYADFLSNRQIQAIMYTGGAALNNSGDSHQFAWQRWGWKLHQHVIKRFESGLNPEQTAVMAGLVVGQRPRFNPDLKNIFLRSGTMHVLVASGSNIAFVMMMWFFLLRVMRVPNLSALVTALGPVWIYVLISGGDAPLVRAAVMATAFVLSHVLRRWDKPFNALGLAAWTILLFNPRALFDLGFQMSFLTVLGLLLTMPWLESLISKLPAWSKWPLRVLAASVTAELWLLPIGVQAFHYIYPWSFLSNMCVVPMSVLGLPLGFALTFFHHVNWLVQMYTNGLLWLVRFMSNHIGWRCWLSPWTPVAIIGYYQILLALPKIRSSLLGRFVLLSGLAMLIWPSHHARPVSDLNITWINCGRCCATLIENRSDRLLLLPQRATSESTLERVLLPYLVTTRKTPITALMTDNPELTQSAMGRELIRQCHISTVTICLSPTLWFRDQQGTILMAPVFTTRLQHYLLEHVKGPIDVVAAHFPPHWRWKSDFTEYFKPRLIVETGNPRHDSELDLPWTDVSVVMPQRTGIFEWKRTSTMPFVQRRFLKNGINTKPAANPPA